MKLTANKIAGILRRKGYRLTPQRHAVLNVIAASHDHLTPGEICSRVQQKHPGIGLVTVYRIINLLTELKLVCRINLDGGNPGYLMRRPTEPHHHLVCSHCGVVVDFNCCEFTSLEERLAQETGFNIDNHILEVRGLCPACQASVAN